ncbi:MAG: peptidase S9, partial [Bacteroidales bacterium]|nr:peptidase S9 [Bacteroidales bacterium]
MRFIYLIMGFASFMWLFSSCVPYEEPKKEETPIDVSLTETEITNGILTPEILWKFGRIGEMKISPNGKELAYTITYYNIEENKGYTHIYKLNIENPEPRALTQGAYNCSNLQWAADGKKIYFISDKNEEAQLFSINSDGSNIVLCDTALNGLIHFEISPDAKNILFCRDVEVGKSVNSDNPDLPKLSVIAADDLMYRHWNHWNDNYWSHIFVASFDGSNVENAIDIMPEEPWDAPLSPYFDNTELSWSSDSKKIVYTCKKMQGREYAESTDSDIYVYDLASGETQNISEGMLGYDKYPSYSPDMKYLAWLSMETPGYEADKDRIMLKDLISGEIKNMSVNFEHPASNLVWDEGSKKIYFNSVINATYQIFVLNIEDGSIEQITEGTHDYTSFEKHGDMLIGAKTKISMATELFKVSTMGEEAQLTFVNKDIYDNITMGEVEERWIKTTDNKQMLTWVIYPPNFDSTKSYPAILYCQGGPQGAVSQFFS